MQGLKILLLTRKFPPLIGGVPNYYKNLILNLKNTNFTVLTNCENDSEAMDSFFKDEKVQVNRVNFIPQNMGASLNFKWLLSLIYTVREIIKISKEIITQLLKRMC